MHTPAPRTWWPASRHVGGVPVQVLIGPPGPGPLVNLREQRRQLLQPQPAAAAAGVPRQRRPGAAPAARRSTGRSAARPTPRPGPRPPASTFGGAGPLSPGGVPTAAPGEPGAVHQPGHRAVVGVAGVPCPGSTQPAEARAAVATAASCSSSAGLRPGSRRSAGRRPRGQVTRPGADHVQRLAAEAGQYPPRSPPPPGLVAAAGATRRPRRAGF